MESRNSQLLREMFDLLLGHFGPQNWWPGGTGLEMMVGAVLTQNTNWKNVQKAIENLKQKNLLSLEALKALSLEELAREIRPSGYYNIKAKRLRNLLGFLADRYEADLEQFLEDTTEALREGLLSVNGIGPETADSILLYAAQRPIFVIDTYTHRILYRHGMIGEEAGYYELQDLFMDHLPADPGFFNEFHALIVRLGKEYCRKVPRCDVCPLLQWGPMPPDSNTA